MAVTRLSDVVIPEEFTAYVIQTSMESSALVQSGVATRNGAIEAQLKAGSEAFHIPFWNDLSDEEADIASDDPDELAVPRKIHAGRQYVRKSYLHASWSAMNLASELAGDDAIARIEARVGAYWQRQAQRRLVATLTGILAGNVADHEGDMVLDITGGTGDAALFSPEGVIDAAGTLGDQMRGLSAIAMHSDTFKQALKADQIESVPDSSGRPFQTYRGMAVIVDDGLPVTDGAYTTVLFAPGAIGWGMTEPRVADGTEVESRPAAGNGGGQQILHSRVNIAVHPAGFAWIESTVAADSPSLAELALAENWQRVIDRRAVPLAFLVHKL